MNCPNCEREMEFHDTTYSNITTSRCNAGDHTGDIYYCEQCDCLFIDNFLTGKLEGWSY